jgi:8-oxo-dGTP diphosphatase
MPQQIAQPIRETARGIILRDDHFLFIRRTRQNSRGGIDSWLSIPGGGLNPGETPNHAIVREMKEELGIAVDTKILLVIQDVPSDESRHYYFLCTIHEGEPHIQEQSEEFKRMQGKVPNTYAIEWTHVNSPELPNGLFWAYAKAYNQFLPFVSSGRREPLVLRTDTKS